MCYLGRVVNIIYITIDNIVRYLQIVGRELNLQTYKEVLLFHFLYVSLKVPRYVPL